MTDKTHTLSLALSATDEPTQSIKLELQNIDPTEIMKGLGEIAKNLMTAPIFKNMKIVADHNIPQPNCPNGQHRDHPKHRSA